jgi:hypothetical protein
VTKGLSIVVEGGDGAGENHAAASAPVPPGGGDVGVNAAEGRDQARSLLRSVAMPSRIRALPRNRVGYPIPYFAAVVDGELDFRVGDSTAYEACIRDRVCWVCGQRRRRAENVFLIGPMCAINRVSQDPPSHAECAEYAAKVCPFLARPNMVRRTRGLPDDTGNAGVAILRNPGVCLVWATATWRTFVPPVGDGYGVLFQLGDPTSTSWWTRGRPATRAEVEASIESGLPLLDAQCDEERDPARARLVLAAQHKQALRYLPAE